MAHFSFKKQFSMLLLGGISPANLLKNMQNRRINGG
jgi:hypothetical protein